MKTTYLVHPALHRIVKFFPTIPPKRGDLVLVDGERRRVTKSRIDWNDRAWTLRELRVTDA